MFKTRSFSCVVVLGLAITALGQGTRDKNGVYHPTQEEIANNKRIAELRRHPTFVVLRLASMRRDLPAEEPSTTPSPYTADQWVHFQLFITQNLTEILTIGESGIYYQYRPKLIRDGEIVPYTKEVQEQVDIAERDVVPRYGSISSTKLEPGRESRGYLVSLESWYESPLPVGRYQLTVRKRFAWDGDWVESNPVTFDVVPRNTPMPIPNGLSLRLVPYEWKSGAERTPHRFSSEVGVAVELINDSNERVTITVIDDYYGHRPQLFKDGKLIPYSAEATKQIELKEKDPRLIQVVSTLFADAKTNSRVDGFSLKEWYGPLAPGVYRLTDRRRFEIGGPWTKDSAELIFEIMP